MAKKQTWNVLEGYQSSCDGPYRSLVCTVFINLSGNTDKRALETKRRLGLSKTSISTAFWDEAGVQGGMCQGMLRNITWDQVENTELSLHFALLWEFVFCRQRGWSHVVCLNLYLIHIHVVHTEAGLWPGSNQQAMGESCSVLTVHGGCWISKAQANRGFSVWD